VGCGPAFAGPLSRSLRPLQARPVRFLASLKSQQQAWIGTRVVHSLCESSGFSNLCPTAWGPGCRRSEPLSTAHHSVSQRDRPPLRSRSRLTFNEQLCFFAPRTDASATQVSYGWWATLALVLAIVPWALVGVMIWMLA
jgi:hypothetical protein